MSIFGKVLDFVGSGVGGKIVEAVAGHFPPNMSEKDRERMNLAITQAARSYELELLHLAHQEQKTFNARIRDMEGTATDLRGAGWPGRIILFFRGIQRPVWGFSVLYLDLMVFSGAWRLTPPVPSAANPETGMLASQVMSSFDLQSAFWLINFLVLGFLFGERAMRNVMPFFHSRIGDGQEGQGGLNQRSGAVG